MIEPREHTKIVYDAACDLCGASSPFSDEDKDTLEILLYGRGWRFIRIVRTNLISQFDEVKCVCKNCVDKINPGTTHSGGEGA